MTLTTPAMLELIERLEKATGPDREVDFQLALLVDWRIASDLTFREWVRDYPHLSRKSDEWPYYTSSIDAALTLKPDGAFWACAPSYELREHRIYKPYDGGTLQWPEWKGEHKHDAIALCIAALRARLSEQNVDGKDVG